MASNSNQNLQYEFLYEIARIDNRAHREELLEYYLSGIGININQGGSILQKILVFPDANHRAQLLNALRGVVRENTASTAPVPHNEAGPSATGNSPSTANNDSSRTSNGQMAPEGNNAVPVMTGEKTSVGEVQIDDNSTQRAEQLLQAQAYIRSVNPYSNQGGSVVHEVSNLPYTNLRSPTLAARHAAGDNTAPVPHNEAGPSASANFPSTATNDSSTTSHGWMAPRKRDARDELALAASHALAGPPRGPPGPLPWFPKIDPSQVEVQETTGGPLGLLKCPICQRKIESKRTKQRGKWSTLEVTKHIQSCLLDKVIGEKVSRHKNTSEIRSFFGLS